MCDVGDGAHLDLRLEPTISVANSRHRAATVVRLVGNATCRVVEEVILGRSEEPSGHLDVSLRVERDGQPLMHHDEAFGPKVAGALSSVSVATARFALAAVIVGPEAGAPVVRVDADCAAALLPVAADAVVLLALGHDRPRSLALLADVAPNLHRN